MDELTAPSRRPDSQDTQGHEPNGDCRALQLWLEQLAAALKGSCADKKADALATLAALRAG